MGKPEVHSFINERSLIEEEICFCSLWGENRYLNQCETLLSFWKKRSRDCSVFHISGGATWLHIVFYCSFSGINAWYHLTGQNNNKLCICTLAMHTELTVLLWTISVKYPCGHKTGCTQRWQLHLYYEIEWCKIRRPVLKTVYYMKTPGVLKTELWCWQWKNETLHQGKS